jgi:hypothetical protein
MSDIQAQARRDAEFDRLLAQCDIGYPDGPMREAYEMGKRHGREEGPRWHDAPTCAGEWSDGLVNWDVQMSADGRPYAEAWGEVVYFDDGVSRWFGPTPIDKVNP